MKNRKTLLKLAWFTFLFALTVCLLMVLRPTLLNHHESVHLVYLSFYDGLIAILGLYIILFFRQYGLLDHLCYAGVFLLAAVGFFLIGRWDQVACLIEPNFYLLTAASGLYFTGVSFIPGLYQSSRNLYNERITQSYSPLIEEFLHNERQYLEIEAEKGRLEKNKESLSRLSDVVRQLNKFMSIDDVSNYLREVLIERIGTGNLAIVIRNEDRAASKRPDANERHFLGHGLSDMMTRYIEFIEDKIGHFFYLSSLSFYTLRIADDWPEADQLENESLTYFLVIPFYVGKKPRGFVGFFLKEQNEIKDLELNFAIFTVRNAALSLNKILLYDQIKRLSLRDGLTRLYLRRVFQERLHEEFDRTKRYSSPLALVIMDVDHFKRFNDNYGHLMGDEVLRKVGGNILQSLEEPMFAARYGGEEFVVICPSCPDVEKFASSVKRLIQDDSVVTESGERLKVTVSVGIAVTSAEIQSAEELIRRADEALYYAKEHGRDKIVVYPGRIV